MVLLKGEKIEKSFLVAKILDSIDFKVYNNQSIGIIGKSGAGKSTLLRCLSTLELVDSGLIFFKDQSFQNICEDHLRKIRKQFGFIFQHPNLLSNKTVLENILLPFYLFGKNNKEHEERAFYLLKMIKMEDKIKAYPSTLSGGQKQRVAIARALMTKSNLIFCDEFTSALDPHTTDEMLELVRGLKDQLGFSIIFITHDMKVLKNLADYVYVLHEGKVVEKGPIKSIVGCPAHPVTQSFLGTLFHDSIPDFLKEKITPVYEEGAHLVLQLVFHSQSATQPLIATLVRQWGIMPNIIGGSLNTVAHESLGHLIISLPYEIQKLDEIFSFFTHHDVTFKKEGFIRW